MNLDVADECEPIRQQMEQYVLNHGYTKLTILLMGMMGHGKSSLINTCLCVSQNEPYYNEAGSGDSAAPITMERKEHRLRGSVYIVDNRGLNKLNVDEQIEIASQFSKLTNFGDVAWNRALDEIFQMFSYRVKNPPTELCVPVLVYSVRCLFSDHMYKDLEPFIRKAQVITGIFPIVVLTRSKYISRKQTVGTIKKVFERLGANTVIPIENYTTENRDRNPTTDKTAMTFLKICLNEAQHIISKRGSFSEADFFRNATRLIKEKVEHEISQRDQAIKEKDEKIKLLEKEIETLKDKCIVM